MKQITDSWVSDSAAQRFFEVAEAAGFEAYFVGGCVRNALLGMPVNDLDITTRATPEEVILLADKAGLRAIPTGIEHGTVTLVGDGAHLEVTTFRKDVETDGRRAVVAFAETIEDDAQRRDFRLNALYADRHGIVLDPTGGGLDDIAARRLRFVGDADARICEDYLRIIRLFRFAAQLGFGAGGMDAEALAASERHAQGLSHVSKERQTAELMKLLAAPAPQDVLEAMAAVGVLHEVLPEARLEPLLAYIAVERQVSALGRLAAATHDGTPSKLRLSKRESETVRLAKGLLGGASLEAFAFEHGAEVAELALGVAAAVHGGHVAKADLERARFAAEQSFPVAAQDLMPRLRGAALGAALKRLEADWIASGFTLDKEALIARALDEE